MQPESAEGKMIRIGIVDDHPFFRQGVREVLSAEPDLMIVVEAEDGEEALQVIPEFAPDVTLMDVNLPGKNGLRITQDLKNAHPDLNFIVLTAYDDEEQIYHAIRIGASAYFAKDVDPERLITTIRAVAKGYFVVGGKRLTPEQAEAWLLECYKRFGVEPDGDTFAPLTPREMEVLELIIEGLSNKGIAYRLGISKQTVKNHVTSILAKLNLSDRTQAAIYALRRGWIRFPEDERNRESA